MSSSPPMSAIPPYVEHDRGKRPFTLEASYAFSGRKDDGAGARFHVSQKMLGPPGNIELVAKAGSRGASRNDPVEFVVVVLVLMSVCCWFLASREGVLEERQRILAWEERMEVRIHALEELQQTLVGLLNAMRVKHLEHDGDRTLVGDKMPTKTPAPPTGPT